MSRHLTVTVTEPAEMDLEAFSLWLKGLNVEAATKVRMEREPAVSQQFRDLQELLLTETADMYRMYFSLLDYLQSPPTFLTQQIFQIPIDIRHRMIELYYNLDDSVVREFLGKKLSARNRRDLDDVSEKTGVSLKSCRRQFDNIKQVLKVVDDYEGSLVENIKVQFHLPDALACRYASIVFMSHNRFETSKKKLAHLLMEDFTSCANLMIEQWTSGSGDSHLVDDDLELDRYFLQELHDLKLSLIDKLWIERHQKFVVRDLKRKHCPQLLIRSVESNFKVFDRAIISLGSSLIHTKDMKDFFIDLMEKIIEPCKVLKWTSDDVHLVMSAMIDTFTDCEVAHLRTYVRPTVKKRWGDVYLRYLTVLSQCIIILYHD